MVHALTDLLAGGVLTAIGVALGGLLMAWKKDQERGLPTRVTEHTEHKMHHALLRAGLTEQQAWDVIEHVKTEGILFREYDPQAKK